MSEIAQATGQSRPANISAALRELDLPTQQRVRESARICWEGGGPRTVTENDLESLAALEALVDPVMRGDPESPLRWPCKSTRQLSDELTAQGHPVSNRTVADLLRQLQSLSELQTREGRSHPERNAQFEFANSSVKRFLNREHLWVDSERLRIVIFSQSFKLIHGLLFLASSVLNLETR